MTAGVTDDDTQKVLVTTGSLSVTEGASNSSGVTLQFVPSGNATVNLSSSNTGVATVSPASPITVAANASAVFSVSPSSTTFTSAGNRTLMITAGSGASNQIGSLTVSGPGLASQTATLRTLRSNSPACPIVDGCGDGVCAPDEPESCCHTDCGAACP